MASRPELIASGATCPPLGNSGENSSKGHGDASVQPAFASKSRGRASHTKTLGQGPPPNARTFVNPGGSGRKIELVKLSGLRLTSCRALNFQKKTGMKAGGG